MATFIVTAAAIVSVLALIASVVIVLATPSSKKVAQAQREALLSTAAAQESADKVLRALEAIGESESADGASDLPRPVRSIFADAIVEVRDRERIVAAVRAERILANIKRREDEQLLVYPASWARVAERLTHEATTPWWFTPDRPITRSTGDDDAWNATGAVPQLV